jgi:hypothetical protein
MKLDEMGQEFDSEVMKWRKEIENHNIISEMLSNVHKYTKEKQARESEIVPQGLITTNIQELGLTFPNTFLPATPQDLDEMSIDSNSDESLPALEDVLYDKDPLLVDFEKGVSNKICSIKEWIKNNCKETLYEDTHYELFNKLCNEVGVNSESLDVMDAENLQKRHIENQPPKYQIIGDNVDLYVKVKHMASERQNKSIHWFGMNAVQNRVTGCHLQNEHPIKPILEMENVEFLPTSEDNKDLLHDFIPLAARILADKVSAFRCFKGAVVRHIPHQYSQQMKQKSHQVHNCNSSIKRFESTGFTAFQ